MTTFADDTPRANKHLIGVAAILQGDLHKIGTTTCHINLNKQKSSHIVLILALPLKKHIWDKRTQFSVKK